MNIKSEKIKKLESELNDLQQWLKLGLVPKSEIEKHQSEIQSIQKRIDEEMQRLQILKESGDDEEFTLHKKSADKRPVYQETATMSGFNTESNYSGENTYDIESDSFDTETSSGDDDSEGGDKDLYDDDEDDPFSDKNRWKRGVLEDPESDSW